MLVAVEPLPQLALSVLNAKTLREEFLRALGGEQAEPRGGRA